MSGLGIREMLYTQPPPKTPQSSSPTTTQNSPIIFTNALKPPKHLNHQHYGWFGHPRGVIYPTTTKTPQSTSPTPLKPRKHLNHQQYGWFGRLRGVLYPTTTQNPPITITNAPKTTQTPYSPALWVVWAFERRYIPTTQNPQSPSPNP